MRSFLIRNANKPSILVLAFVLGCVFAAAFVFAGNLEEKNCTAFARDMAIIASARDAGMPMAEALMRMRQQLDNVVGSPGAYVQDEEDIVRITSAIDYIYKSPQSADEIAYAAYQACVRSAKGKTPV